MRMGCGGTTAIAPVTHITVSHNMPSFRVYPGIHFHITETGFMFTEGLCSHCWAVFREIPDAGGS
jgi:hypothetical protein